VVKAFDSAGIAQGGVISPELFSLYVNDIPMPSHHIKLALCADDTALVSTSKQPQLLLKYLETYLTELETWLQDWRIAINVDKSAAVLFTTRRIPTPRPLRFLGDEIQWVEKVNISRSPLIRDLPGLLT
jgi:Reverse transcriptase (RNA-dependent DNA polymerase).